MIIGTIHDPMSYFRPRLWLTSISNFFRHKKSAHASAIAWCLSSRMFGSVPASHLEARPSRPGRAMLGHASITSIPRCPRQVR